MLTADHAFHASWANQTYLDAVGEALGRGSGARMVVHVPGRAALPQQPGLQHIHQLGGAHLPALACLSAGSLGSGQVPVRPA